MKRRRNNTINCSEMDEDCRVKRVHTSLLLQMLACILLIFHVSGCHGEIMSNNNPLTGNFDNNEMQSALVAASHMRIQDKVEEAVAKYFSLEDLSNTTEILDIVHDTTSPLSMRRMLSPGKFEAFNNFLKALTVHVPPMTDVIADLPAPFTQLLIDITEMKCFNIALYDAQVKFNRVNAKELRPTITLDDIAVDCTFNWHYTYDARLLGWIQGSGSAILQFHQADLTTTLAIKSETTLEMEFPNQIDVIDCGADFQIKDMKFFGSVQANMADSFQGKVRETVKKQANGAVCEKLMSLDGELDAAIKEVAGEMTKILNQLEETKKENAVEDPIIPDDVDLFDFTEENFFTSMLEQLQSAFYVEPSKSGEGGGGNKRRLQDGDEDSGSANLGRFVNDIDLVELLDGLSIEGLAPMLASLASSVNGGGSGINVNQLIRDNFLDEDGLFHIPLEETVLFNGLEEFMETEVTFLGGHMKGLDSISELIVLQVTGPQDLRTKIALNTLEVEVDLKIKTKAKSTSQFLQWDPKKAGDQPDKFVTIKAGASGIYIDFTVFLGIDKTYIENMSLGTLLLADSMVSCAIKSIYALQLKAFDAGIESVQTPSIDGFNSPGINRLFTQVLDGLFMIVSQFVASLVPLVIETDVKAMINTMIQDFLQDVAEGNTCPAFDPSKFDMGGHKHVDLRDLLLTPPDAKALGGSGKAPYGEIIPVIKKLLDEQVFAASSSTGLSLFNDYVIAPLTIASSGEAGTFVMQGDAVNETSVLDVPGLSGTFHMAVSGPTIEHLNTFGEMKVFDPIQNERYKLDNHMELSVSNPIRANTSIVVSFEHDIKSDDGNSSSLQFFNKINLSVAMDNAAAIATLMAKIDALEFMSFRLGRALSWDCWIATLFPLELEDGSSHSGNDTIKDNEFSSSQKVLGVENFLLSLQELIMNVKCIDCSSSRLRNLPETLNATNYMNRALKYTSSILNEGIFQPKLNKLRLDSMSKCFEASPDKSVNTTTTTSSPRDPSDGSEGDEGDVGDEDDGDINDAVAVSRSATNETLSTDSSSGGVFGNEDSEEENINELSYVHNENSQGGTDADGYYYYNDDDVRYYDFSADNWINTLLDQVRNMINFSNDTVVDNELVRRALQQIPGLDIDLSDIDYTEGLDVNAIIRDLFLDEDGAFNFPFGDMVVLEPNPDNFETKVTLQSVSIKGLDSIKHLNVLEVLAPQVLRNNLAIGNLNIVVDFSIETALDNGIDGAPDIQNATVSVNIKDFALEADIFVGIDSDYVETLSIGTLLTAEDLLGCAFAAVDKVHMKKLNVTLGGIETPIINGVLPTDLNEFLNDSLDITFTILESFFQNWIFQLAAQDVKALANEFLHDYLEKRERESLCSFFDSSTLKEEYIDFRDMFLLPSESSAFGGSGLAPYGTLLPTAKRVLNEEVLAVDPSTGLSKLNELIVVPLTDSFSAENVNVADGTFVMPKDVINFKNKIDVPGLDGELELLISNVYVENLNSVGSVAVANPRSSSPHILDNHVEVAMANRPIRASTRMVLGFKSESVQFRNDIQLTVVLEAAKLLASIMARISSQRFMDFPLRDLTNPYCWLSNIPAPELDEYGVRLPGETPTTDIADFSMSFGDLMIDVDCLECSSPKLREFSKVNATEFGRNITRLIENLVLGNHTQVQMNRLITNAAAKCPHRFDEGGYRFDEVQFSAFENDPDSAQEEGSFLVALLIVLGCAFFVLAFIMLTTRCVVRRKHFKYMESLTSEDKRILLKKQSIIEDEAKKIDMSTTSMFTSKQVPIAVRILMPLIVLANIALFLSGHLSLGAAVVVDLEFAGEPMKLDNFFLFSMARSTRDMWRAGAKELAMFILIFSGIWPYTKQLISLILWFLPTKWCPVRRRGKIYDWLDILAKWSMVDIFVLVISLVAFRISIQSPSDGALAFLDLYSIDFLIVPMWGLYANMMAQLVSQVTSHYILHYQAKIVKEARRSIQSNTPDEVTGNEDDADVCEVAETGVSLVRPISLVQEPLYRHKFRVSRSSKGKILNVRPWVNYMLPFLALLTIAVTIVGCVVPSFQLEVLGLFGIAVELGQSGEAAVSYYSVISIVSTLFGQASYVGTIAAHVGLGVLALLFAFSVLVVPIVQTCLLMFLWFGNLKVESKGRTRVVWTLEILRAWQYVEVYLFSIIIATWQIGGISEFFFDDVVGDSMNDILEALVNFGLIDQVDARVFYVSSRIQLGTYFLVAAAVFLWMLDQFVSRAEKQQRLEGEDISRFTAAAMKAAGVVVDDYPEEELDARVKPLRILFTDCFRWFLQAAPGAAAADLECVPSFQSDSDESGDGATPPRLKVASVEQNVMIAPVEGNTMIAPVEDDDDIMVARAFDVMV